MVDSLVPLLLESDCTFCKINAARGSNVTDLGQKYMCIESIKPLDEVHLLICPKYHLETYLDGTASTKPHNQFQEPKKAYSVELELLIKQLKKQCKAELLDLAQQEILKRGLKSAKIVINYYPPYASVNHAHLHVIGHANTQVFEKQYKEKVIVV